MYYGYRELSSRPPKQLSTEDNIQQFSGIWEINYMIISNFSSCLSKFLLNLGILEFYDSDGMELYLSLALSGNTEYIIVKLESVVL